MIRFWILPHLLINTRSQGATWFREKAMSYIQTLSDKKFNYLTDTIDDIDEEIQNELEA